MASYYAEQFAGDNYFGQSGTNTPSFGIQGGYAGGFSTDVPPYFGGYVANAPAPGTGSSPYQPFDRDLIEKMSKPGQLPTPDAKEFLRGVLDRLKSNSGPQAANFMGASGSAIPGAAQPTRQPILPGEQQNLIQSVYGQPATQQRYIQPGLLQLPPA